MKLNDIMQQAKDVISQLDPSDIRAAKEAMDIDTSTDPDVVVTGEGKLGEKPIESTTENLIKFGVNLYNDFTSPDQAPTAQDETTHIKETATDSNYIDYIDKKRLVEMYVYQEKKYEAYLDIFTQLTFYCVILLILAILKKRFILSDRFTKILIFVLVVVSGIHMYLKIADVNMRNSINFDEYDWSFSTNNQSDPNKIDTNLHEKTKGGASCVEASCCNTDFTKWCATQGLCIPKEMECSGATRLNIAKLNDNSGTTEPFTQMASPDIHSGPTTPKVDGIITNSPPKNKNSILVMHGVWPKNPDDGLVYEQGGGKYGMWVGVWNNKFLARGYDGEFSMPLNDDWDSNDMTNGGIMARLNQNQTADLYDGNYHFVVVEFSQTNKNIRIWMDGMDIANPIVTGVKSNNLNLYGNLLHDGNPGNFNRESTSTVFPNNDITTSANTPLTKDDEQNTETPYYWLIHYDKDKEPHNTLNGSILEFYKTFITSDDSVQDNEVDNTLNDSISQLYKKFTS